MTFAIRSYHPSDLCALDRVCLMTGDNVNDASLTYRAPELMGQIPIYISTCCPAPREAVGGER